MLILAVIILIITVIIIIIISSVISITSAAIVLKIIRSLKQSFRLHCYYCFCCNNFYFHNFGFHSVAVHNYGGDGSFGIFFDFWFDVLIFLPPNIGYPSLSDRWLRWLLASWRGSWVVSLSTTGGVSGFCSIFSTFFACSSIIDNSPIFKVCFTWNLCFSCHWGWVRSALRGDIGLVVC